MNQPIFVFPGLGAQWAGMGQALLKEDPVFAGAVAELDPLFADVGEAVPGELLRRSDPAAFDASDSAHLLTFAYQIGLTAALAHRGIVPAGVVGHSSGEVAAAVAAGILPLPAAVTLVAAHAALIRAVAGQGEMLFAALSPAQAAELAAAHSGVEIASFNSRAAVVFSGAAAPLRKLAGELEARRVFCRPLRTSIAFHSAILDPHLDRFEQRLLDLATAPPVAPGTLP